jgi:hypothetical protein
MTLGSRGKYLLLLPNDEQNTKRIKSIEHSKAKGQVDMMGVQLVDIVKDLIRIGWNFLPNRDMDPVCFIGQRAW